MYTRMKSYPAVAGDVKNTHIGKFSKGPHHLFAGGILGFGHDCKMRSQLLCLCPHFFIIKAAEHPVDGHTEKQQHNQEHRHDHKTELKADDVIFHSLVPGT
ncbi:hypothetical protein D3C73_965250 [compost metagenome]